MSQEIEELRAKLVQADANLAALVKKRDADIAELEKERAAWKNAIVTKAQSCETCQGMGTMDALVAYDPRDGAEKTEEMPCAECYGTGKGALVTAAFEIVRQQEREACIAILASAEPNTKVERILETLGDLDDSGDLDPVVGTLISQLGHAMAEELDEMEALIRARGTGAPKAWGELPHDTDPADSDRLRALRDLIDEELGWPTMAAQEGGDYEGRIREVAAQRRAIAEAWSEPGEAAAARLSGRIEPLLDTLAREVARKFDDPDETSSARRIR